MLNLVKNYNNLLEKDQKKLNVLFYSDVFALAVKLRYIDHMNDSSIASKLCLSINNINLVYGQGIGYLERYRKYLSDEEPKELIGTSQVAGYIGCSTGWVNRNIDKIPHIKQGRKYIFKVLDLENIKGCVSAGKPYK